MFERFQGTEGKRLLVDALRQQSTLQCIEPAICELASAAFVEDYSPSALLIAQNADDNRIAFIISGRTKVLVKGKVVAHRSAGQHVGEMSLIDPKARRSASVVAIEETCVAWVDEPTFTRVAQAYPELWRALAVELADRIRQRGALIRAPNEKPAIFIGSSSEALKVAKRLRKGLASDTTEILLWNKDVFELSKTTIEDLESASRYTDFAVLVLAADDHLTSRRKRYRAPRDNVVFELGLFMGALGRDRTFLLVESGRNVRLPPDLDGVTQLRFSTESKNSLSRTMIAATSEILSRVAESSVRVG